MDSLSPRISAQSRINPKYPVIAKFEIFAEEFLFAERRWIKNIGQTGM